MTDNNLYEELYKKNKLIADANKQLVLENRKLKRALNALLSQMLNASSQWDEYAAEMQSLDKLVEKYRKLNLEVDDSIDDTE